MSYKIAQSLCVFITAMDECLKQSTFALESEKYRKTCRGFPPFHTYFKGVYKKTVKSQWSKATYFSENTELSDSSRK